MSSGSHTGCPARAAASSRFGVTSLAKGNSRLFRAASALGFSNGVPLLEIITGSITSCSPRRLAKRLATASMIGCENNIPVFTALTGRLANTASNCASTTLALADWIAVTSLGVCAVTHVTTLAPCTPSELKTRKSACTPAPPPQSDPATVKAAWRFCLNLPVSLDIKGKKYITCLTCGQ